MLVINAGGNDRVECNIDVSEKDDRKTVVSYGYHPDKVVFSNFINRHNDEIDQLLKSAKDEQ
ncbi:MAG: hypothetical protein K5929_03360 [Lachnospiraceae bacterium]|nr:hypothetical protein [Lachnospiraceae bacterium]